MSNDTGRGGWPEERPTRASVRHLHGDEADGSGETATDEWYETERLAGQITGGGRAAGPAFSQREAAGVLDWRHVEIAPAPTALRRLGRSLADRGHGVVSLLVIAGHRRNGLGARDANVRSQTRVRRPRLAVRAAGRAVAPPAVEAREDKPTADEILVAEPSRPPTGPRGCAEFASERLDWRSEPAPRARGERRRRPWRRGLIGTAFVLAAAAVGVIAITSHTNGRAVNSRQASFAGAASRSRAALIAARTVIGVLGTVEHHGRMTAARRRIVARPAYSRRRPNTNAHQRHSGPAGPYASSPAPKALAASQADSSAGGGSTISTGATSSQTPAAPGNGGSTISTPASSSETSPAPDSSSRSTPPVSAASHSQPAGPTGQAAILGPGHCSC